VSVIAGASIEDGGEEIGRISDAPEHVSGRRPLGFIAPYPYDRGVMDRPDWLAILHDQGIRSLHGLGRDRHEGQPRDLDRPA